MAGHVIGLIADTHGLLRPEAVQALRRAERIIHAGDIDTPNVLHALQVLARVTAVRGNVDTGGWMTGLPQTATLAVDLVQIPSSHGTRWPFTTSADGVTIPGVIPTSGVV
jgi:hypothetical protein